MSLAVDGCGWQLWWLPLEISKRIRTAFCQSHLELLPRTWKGICEAESRHKEITLALLLRIPKYRPAQKHQLHSRNMWHVYILRTHTYTIIYANMIYSFMYLLTYYDEKSCELCSTSSHVLNTKVVLVPETQQIAGFYWHFHLMFLLVPKNTSFLRVGSHLPPMKFLCGAHALVVNGRWNLLPSCWNWKVGPNLWKKPRSKPICNCDRCNMAAGSPRNRSWFHMFSPEIVPEIVVARAWWNVGYDFLPRFRLQESMSQHYIYIFYHDYHGLLSLWGW